MAKFACLPYFLVVKKKKSKGFSKAADGNEKRSSKGDLRVKPIDLFSPSPEDHLTVLKSLPSVQKGSSITPMVLSDDSFARAKPTGERAYEGGDYTDEIRSMKRDYSDLESPVLKRSCSNIETKQAKQWINSSKRSSSYSNNLQNLSGNGRVEITRETHTSPLFIRSSSSQVLPSRSKKIWRKLFLRSHRNLHKLRAPQRLVSVLSAPNLKGGYSSDGHEPCQKLDDKWKKAIESENQWVAFSLGSSPVDRVNAWVNSLDDCSLFSVGGEEYCGGMEDEQTTDLHDLVIVESSEKTCSQTNRRVAEEVAQANNIIQSLNTSSTVAHIPGIGLKVIPSISVFVCLRSVNLSGNCIVSITPGSLPKSLHTLDLSRNKISTIEGLRDLERLRVLNLSYNRIAKISHGLSSCTLIKELYLAGNKISNVEGLHRLLKLTVLDLSFNKIITAKGLGQLVANYNSLLALNLLGNPILANIGDDQVRKAVLSLLPHVTYLNKQSIKPDKVREVVSESVTKAALGDVAGSSKRKLTKRLSHVSGSLPKSKVVETIKHGKSRHSTSGKLAQ